jgi:hypothetical protein
LYQIVAAWIQKGMDSGIFRNDLELPLVYYNQIQKISALLYSTVTDSPEPFTPQAAYVLLLNDIRGITTLRGHEIFDRDYNIFLQKIDWKTKN